MKMSPLSKEEKAHIENIYHDNNASEIDVTKLSKEMNRSESMINKYLDKINKERLEVGVEDTPIVKDVSGLYAKNKQYGATIMTETASINSDENKKNKSGMVPRYHKHIHRIKD